MCVRDIVFELNTVSLPFLPLSMENETHHDVLHREGLVQTDRLEHAHSGQVATQPSLHTLALNMERREERGVTQSVSSTKHTAMGTWCRDRQKSHIKRRHIWLRSEPASQDCRDLVMMDFCLCMLMMKHFLDLHNCTRACTYPHGLDVALVSSSVSSTALFI